MILQELVRYTDRQRNLPSSGMPLSGWIRRPVDYCLVLEHDGRCVQIEQKFEVVKGRRIGQSWLLPSIGKQALKHTNSGKDANLLWDNASFALGHGARGSMKLAGFVSTIEEWFGDCNEPGVSAVLAFTKGLLAAPQQVEALLHKFRLVEDFDVRDPVLCFRLVEDGPMPIHERETVRELIAAHASISRDALRRGRCLITGAGNVPLVDNETVIKGVWRSQTSGANLVSFNAASFVSYGKQGRQAESAPISAEASAAYTGGLNHLLGSERNRVQVGDASAVFWADGPAPLLDGEFNLADFLGEPRDQPDRGVQAVQALYRALASGQLPVGERETRFFVLGLAPNAARISVRFWISATVAELAPRIRQHFDDLRVVPRYDSDPPVPSLFRLLTGLALQGKVDNVPPRLAGEWMRAMLEGQPYPALLLNAAVIRCKAEREVSYLRAAVLKAWLNRDTRRRQPQLSADHAEFKEELDMDQADAAYRLGRVFAVLERIQQRAQPGINATIRDRYFGAASTTPVAVFTTLLRLKNAHLKKLGDGEVAYFERLLGSIFGTLEAPALAEFPRQLNLPDQGRFALGYYHQRQSFFAGRKPDDDGKPSHDSPDTQED
jgi:CRISPR-associated protein Csd1